jgi:hypothetical protein
MPDGIVPTLAYLRGLAPPDKAANFPQITQPASTAHGVVVVQTPAIVSCRATAIDRLTVAV